MEFRETTLDNGLEVVAECNAECQTLALGFFVKAGARDETDEISGVSHFLEHMSFKGTSRRSATDINRQFDEIGAHYNAFTSEERTVYYAAILPEYQRAALDLLADILRPALREEDFETEKKVILEEIQMYLDQPPYGADDRLRSLYFGNHPLGRSVLGTQQSISGLSVEAMRTYHRARYTPHNITLVAAGRVDFDGLVAAAEELCGGWPSQAAVRPTSRAHPQCGFLSLIKESSQQQYVLQLAAAPCDHDPDWFAARVLTVVLGDNPGGRLYWTFIEPGLAHEASLGHMDYQDNGLFLTWLACDPELTAANLRRLRDLYFDAQQQGITADELERAKCKLASGVVLAGEHSRSRLFAVGGNWTTRHEYRSVADDLRMIDALQLEQVNQVLRDWPLSACATVTIGPRGDVPEPL
ncbi:MAG: insulinase family protein [Pirellulales bacterium]|nr:insulinase family protein [Pirellulales bacterium]